MADKYSPECPFCSRFIKRPEKTITELGEVIFNRCVCGAVYVCDPTGHNIGEALMDAYALFNRFWEVDSLSEETDCFVKEIDYDLKSHRYISVKGDNRTTGRLVFINPKDSAPRREKTLKIQGGDIKKRLKLLLNEMRYEDIAEMAEDNHAVISKLISMSYDKRDVLTWRAIEAFREVARRLAISDQPVIRNTIRRLLWSMSDESGGIGWSACEMLGSIISSNPADYEDVIPLLWSCREEEMFRAGTMWAIALIASVDSNAVSFVCNELPVYLADKDPAVRGYAVVCACLIQCPVNNTELLSRIFADTGELFYYKDGTLQKKTVASLAACMLANPN